LFYIYLILLAISLMYLNCHTYFSLRYGIMSPEELVHYAIENDIKTMVLTDINNTSCAGEFIDCCQKAGIKGLLGIDFRNDTGECLYIGIARNQEGFSELNTFLTDFSMKRKALPLLPPAFSNCWIVFPRLVKPIEQFRENEFLGIRREHIARLFRHPITHAHKHKLVALSPVTFRNEEDYQVHLHLRAIDKNKLLTHLLPKERGSKQDKMQPVSLVEEPYLVYPEIIQNTKKILALSSVTLKKGLSVNRLHFTGSMEGDYALLEKLAQSGCQRRYGELPAARDRMRQEMKVIQTHQFCAYFLITWDIVRYARSAGYHHVGRGSGANSIVAYCLGISDVDPLELNLYFERFINPHRTSPPDFDIDFSWDERDDITDYIFKRYGQPYVALLATYNTFQRKAAIRELGKVYGLPKGEIDKLVIKQEQGAPTRHELESVILYYAERLIDKPNHLSIHAGGVLISEAPLSYHTACMLMPKGFPVTHFDMHHAESLGFHKFDVLSQRGLGHIKDAVSLIRQRHKQDIDIHDIKLLKNDLKSIELLRSAKCLGCFYIESPAMRGLLRKLHCDNYIHLVAASSIIRPGVASSGMMKAYIQRTHDPCGFKYPHAVFEEQLSETYGIMVYQEDVMKILHHFAGLDLGESDVVRRIMTGKKLKDDTLERLKEKYFKQCQQRGHPESLATEVWRQIESFAGYSFCKAHSASFAVESFQSLYLKAHFPLEFITAVINNFGGFYPTEFYVHEAKILGATVQAPCVNNSQYMSSLVNENELYLGFVHLKELESQSVQKLIDQRENHGPFRDFSDFVERVSLGPTQLDLLIRVGAFRFCGKSKYELFWEKNDLVSTLRDQDNPSLFSEADNKMQRVQNTENHTFTSLLSVVKENKLNQSFDELELLGFPLCNPFDLIQDHTSLNDTILARQMIRFKNRNIKMAGYFVCSKSLATIKKERMAFGTWIDKEGNYFDTTHFPEQLAKYPFRGKGVYIIEGKATEEFGFFSLEVFKMNRLAFLEDERFCD
jgi:DNA-directed DNA polymerase III PolC